MHGLASDGGGRVAVAALVGYLLGCANAAYYLMKWRTRQDIRSLGTGNAGATNVGRVLGKWGFASVFLFDFAKGAAAVGLAALMELSPEGQGLVAVAVTAGHVWPLQLGFRGGKGIATALGSLLVFDVTLLGVLGAVFLPIHAVCRRFVLSGLLAFAIAPLALWAFQWPRSAVRCMAALTLVVGVAHRSNLAGELHGSVSGHRRRGEAAVRSTPPPS